MLKLYLLRHAKSSWNAADLSDFDRPLSDRGLRDAPLMGAYIAKHLAAPDLVLCSTAERTRRTLDLVLPALPGIPPRVVFEDGIYEASPSRLMNRIRGIEDANRIVLLIGHNPGIHGAALELTGSGQTALVRDMAVKYPTCALAVLAFETDHWSDVRPATGRLLHFVKPRSLPD